MELFLLVIFWIIVMYYAFKLTLRYAVPWLVKRYIRKMQRNMDGFGKGPSSAQDRDGLKVDPTGKGETRIDPDAGEYVDFEEIKDNPKSE
jgi:hypothetical protein